MTSKNSLKRPLYEALKIGVTAITPSAAEDGVERRLEHGLGKPVSRWLVRSWHGRAAR